MREFYQRVSDTVLAAQALTGTSAFVSLVTPDPNTLIATVLTGIVGLASVLELVFRFSQKAERHDRLSRRFTELAAQIEQWPEDTKHFQQAKASRLSIEVDEPTERRLIDLRAQNDECAARGVPMDRLIPLSFWQRSWLAYAFTFGEDGIRRRIADRDRT